MTAGPELPQISQLLLSLALLGATSPAADSQALVEIRTGIPPARFIPEYSVLERARVAKRVLRLSVQPELGLSISLTPNASFAQDGSHLSFWKPSFVIGTENGGEAGINFWGHFEQGHVNVGVPAQRKKAVLLDCRVISGGDIAYKIYRSSATPDEAGKISLHDGHLLLVVAVGAAATSVELWPAREKQAVGILGCDLNTILERHT
jgi:hypothetical protein